MSEEQKTSLSPEQQRVIETWGKGMAVLAGAGSGKTTTLVAKCARLVQLNSKARFAAVSFTERSASDLRAKLSQALFKLEEPGALHQHWVMTIHGLCGAIIREYPREAGFDGEETVLADADAQLLWERAIDAIWLEDLPDAIRVHLESLLNRESRDALAGLLKRIRELFSFDVLSSLRSSEDPSAQALQSVAGYVMERYTRLKRRQGSIDFNDLERGADRALESREVSEAYQRRFELILVDEFQDTNPLQAKIIWRLARADASNLCVVGDPKQSIYRFRDADVSVFEEYCSRLPIQQSLTWNFRSLSGIIQFANQLCEKAFLASEMKFEALVPKREQMPEQETVIRLDVQNPVELGTWIQQEVARGVPLHDMALLVRKIRGNEKWFKALTASGIPIAIGSGGLFWEEPRVRELVAFLKWWDNPGNALSGAVFLRAPWMGISDLDLDRWIKEDPTWRSSFFSSDHPMAQQLKLFMNRVVRPGELLMALLMNQQIEDELGAPLLGLWHRAEELSSRGLDFHGVVISLSNAIQENRREREVPAPRNLGQLSILTLHGSKGLEFPHVILIDLGAKGRASDSPLLFWDRTQGAYLGTRDNHGEREKDHPVEANWREIEKKKNLAECKRLFYVALTRARERLILVCPELPEPPQSKKEFSSSEPNLAYHQDHWRAWIECCGIELPQAKRESRVQLSSPVPQNVSLEQKWISRHGSTSQKWMRARHSVTEWTLLSRCPRAYEWTFIRPIPVVKGTPEAGLLTGEKVPTLLENQLSHQELGSRVHQCLEHGNFEGLKALEEEVGSSRFLAEPVMSWALSSEWMAPANPKRGRDVWTELNFEVPLGREVLVGSIDRLVCVTEGSSSRYFLIDFKVTGRPKSVEVLLEAYQTQIELYSWALTALDQNIQLNQIEPLLVNISSHTVQTVPVPLGKIDIKALVDCSINIIDGAPGKPKPGPLCRVCEFQGQCPEGSKVSE